MDMFVLILRHIYPTDKFDEDQKYIRIFVIHYSLDLAKVSRIAYIKSIMSLDVSECKHSGT